MSWIKMPGDSKIHHKPKKGSPKMNPEVFLNEIAIAIKTRDRGHAGMYIIGIDEGNAICIPCKDNPKIDHVLGIYKSLQLEQGFTSAQWDSLCYRVAKAWAQEKI